MITLEDNYIKILDSFNFDEFITTKEMKESLNKSNHIEAMKIMRRNNITQPYDYSRSCGESGFTDFALNKLEKITQEDSKYIISRNINGETVYLYTNNLQEIVDDMNRLANKGYFDTVKSNNKKIKGYFKAENEIIIGKESTGKIKIILEKADINSIVTRKYYLFDKNHLSIQAQLAALGQYFGYKSKIAKNDKNKDIYGVNLNTICIATIEDIDISNLKSEKSLEKIDYVDVIWVGKNSNNLTVALEVEFKGDWVGTIVRLLSVSLASSTPEKVVNIIVSDKEEDYFVIRDTAKMDIIQLLSIKSKIAHITTQNLVNILKMRDSGIDKELIKRKFFSEIRYI